jgi:hypothetical protein
MELWHYNGATGQAQLGTADVVARVAADPNGSHLVWKPGFAAWKSFREVPEIAAALPPPPVAAPPPPPMPAQYHYAGPSGQGVKSLDQVVAEVQANPGAAHHVWQNGWAGWKSAAEVPEIAAKLGPPGPPPPPR